MCELNEANTFTLPPRADTVLTARESLPTMLQYWRLANVRGILPNRVPLLGAHDLVFLSLGVGGSQSDSGPKIYHAAAGLAAGPTSIARCME